MSQELVQVAVPKALALPAEERAAMMEAFAENVSMGALSEFDLPRIKVMTGAALWLLPGLEREETTHRIEGIILLKRNARVYYASKDAGNVPPNCSSANGVTGVGDPGGECVKCDFAKWDSALDGGGGQACKQVTQLFFLRMDSIFPEVVTLPPTSMKAAKQFFVRAATQGVTYHKAIVAIELEKAQNAKSQPYGRAKITFLRRLTDDEIAGIAQFRALAQQIAGEVQTAATATE
jgi:hypothetical protein